MVIFIFVQRSGKIHGSEKVHRISTLGIAGILNGMSTSGDTSLGRLPHRHKHIRNWVDMMVKTVKLT